MTRTIISKVAGVTYESRQETIAKLKGDEPCRIVPEPDNPWDANALAVHVAVAPGEIKHVGFIPRDLAAQIAPFLEGEQIDVELLKVIGGFETRDGEHAALGLLIQIVVPGMYDPAGDKFDESNIDPNRFDDDLPVLKDGAQ